MSNNIALRFILAIWLVIFFAFSLTSCSFLEGLTGKENGEEETGDEETGAGGTTLRVTVLNNPVDQQTVSGALVFLNEPSASSSSTYQTKAAGDLIDYLTTASDGVADFGKIEWSQITLSVAFEEIDNSTGDIDHIITTYNIVKGGDITVFKDLWWGEEEQPIATIDVQVVSLPSGYYSTNVLPMWSWKDSSYNGLHSSIEVYPADVEKDGEISLLAYAEDSDYVPMEYGFVTDQTLTDGGYYEVSLDSSPGTLYFSSNRPLDVIYAEIYRSGVYFNGGDEWWDTPVQSGTVKIFDRFPLSGEAGNYYDAWVWGSNSSSTNEWRGYSYTEYFEGYSSFPLDITLDIPTLQIDSLDYDFTNGEVWWSTSGTALLDVATGSMDRSFTDSYGNTVWEYWTLLSDPAPSQIILPTLPPAIEEWFSSSPDYLYMDLVDLKNINGYEDILSFAFDPSSLTSEPLHFFDAYYEISLDSGTSSKSLHEKKPIERHLWLFDPHRE